MWWSVFWSIEAIGWVGDVLFVLSYLLVSQGKINPKGKLFNFMNLGGAVLFGIYATLKSAVPILILECFWGGIALVALYKVFRRKPEGYITPSLAARARANRQ